MSNDTLHRSSAEPAVGPIQHLSMSDLDWMSGDGWVIYGFGPLTLPSRSRMVDALLTVAELGPQSKVGLQFADNRTGWTYDASTLREWCETLVTEIDPIAAADIPSLVKTFASENDRPPISFVIAGEYLFVRMHHRLGDASLLLSLLNLVLTWQPGDELPAWLLTASEPRPMRAALRNTFLGRPALLGKVYASQRSRLTSRSAPPLDAGVQPWVRSPATAYARISASATAKLKEWTGAQTPRPSQASTMLVAFRRALTEVGIPVQGASSMVYDARRYLPEGSQVVGNFIAGLPVPDGHSDDPQLVTKVVRDNADAASPLAGMVVGLARTRLSGHSVMPVTFVDAHPAAMVVMSSVGLRREFNSLDWHVPLGDETFVLWSEPSGPDNIVFAMLQIGGTLHASAFYNENVFTPAAVQAAMDLLGADPVALLELP